MLAGLVAISFTLAPISRATYAWIHGLFERFAAAPYLGTSRRGGRELPRPTSSQKPAPSRPSTTDISFRVRIGSIRRRVRRASRPDERLSASHRGHPGKGPDADGRRIDRRRSDRRRRDGAFLLP